MASYDLPVTLFDNGYTDLIAVKGKAPVEKGWTKLTPSRSQVYAWVEAHMNVGLRTRNFPAIDCDVTDPLLSMQIRGLTREHFGTKQPIRTGKPPKWLMVFRLEGTPLTKQKIIFSKGDAEYAIELLGDGQQFVVYGVHPDTQEDYTWEEPTSGHPKYIGEMPAKNLKPLDSAGWEEYVTKVRAWLEGRGWTVRVTGAAVTTSVKAREDLYAPSFELLESAVRATTNKEDTTREIYVKYAHAIKGSCRPEWEDLGLALFSEWAAKWPGGHDAAHDTHVWDSITDTTLGWGIVRMIAEQCGWSETERAATVDAQEDFAADVVAPEDVPELVAATTEGPQIGELADPAAAAELVAEQVKDKVFTTGPKDCYLWDGTYWKPDRMEGAHARGIVRKALYALVPQLVAKYPDSEQLTKVCKKLRTTAFGDLVWKHVLDEAMLYRDPATVDDVATIGQILNTPDRMIDLELAISQPHKPYYYITQRTNVSPDRNEACPVWARFLLSSCGGDESLVEYMQWVMGGMLVAGNPQRLMWFLVGPSGSGKSTILKHIHAILGDYGGLLPAGLLVRGQRAAHETSTSTMKGRRFLYGSEINKGDRWDISMMKQLSGNEMISGRRMFRAPESFRIIGKVIIAGNETPMLGNVDSAVERRMRIINFHEPEELDPKLDAKLEVEYPAILTWLIRGAHMYLTIDEPECEAVRAGTQEYLEEENVVARFLGERCLITGNPNAHVPTAWLWSYWEQYTTREMRVKLGITEANTFAKAVKAADKRIDKGRQRIEGINMRTFTGLSLREDVDINVEDIL
jgi:P4 family phage/plasmid primase-like protien